MNQRCCLCLDEHPASEMAQYTAIPCCKKCHNPLPAKGETSAKPLTAESDFYRDGEFDIDPY